MKEQAFLRYVTDVATRFGWRWWHVPSPMRSAEGGRGWVGAREAAGLCDLVLIHEDPPRLILAELKGTNGSLSEKQREFLSAAQQVAIRSCDRDSEYDGQPWIPATVGVYVWTPDDQPTVENILRTRVLI